MRFLNVKVTNEDTGKIISRFKIPIFVIALVGKYAPEVLYDFVVRNIETVRPEDQELISTVSKGTIKMVINIVRDAAKDEQLKDYDGIILDACIDNEKVFITIK
ncbi:hypothetical protein CWB73_20630 [Pseudoalteromonas phenolica]|uniref:Uncharacterized protein n=1 Tax=Pseudoalteromonas phenolica TaxID=161398 RepID=A0A5S3YNX3_9GAMM|nr:hypothetical protein [Pseudoalteromonas phenolica]TMP77172.1 hypothetical protein CWB73_20630 [Pseudoalteromonas phenolica]